MTPRSGFERELKQLKNKVSEMGECVRMNYEKLLMAVREKDSEMLKSLLDSDREMVDMLRSIEACCLALMTRQQPVVAGDLRFVTAALKIVTDLERIGDHVGDMSELYLRRPVITENDKEDATLLEMLYRAKNMISEVVTAFTEENGKAVREVIESDDILDGLFNQMKEILMEAIRNQVIDPDKVVDSLMIAKYLEKVGDHAVNIGEWTLFRITGDIEGREIY